MKLCVIIPAYNEAGTISGLINAVRQYVADVLLINDGSTDRTEEIAKAAGAAVLSFEHNAGKGKAIKAGFDYALRNGYDAVVTMDADGQHSPSDLLQITGAARSPDVGIVAGNRMADPKDMPQIRFLTNFFMSFIISGLCRQAIPDTQCGFRLIKCEALKKMRLVSANYEIESELLLRASRLGYRIISVPVKSVYTGQVSLINPLLDTWRFLVMLVRILLTQDTPSPSEEVPQKTLSPSGEAPQDTLSPLGRGLG